jgi:hypothetical protein
VEEDAHSLWCAQILHDLPLSHFAPPRGAFFVPFRFGGLQPFDGSAHLLQGNVTDIPPPHQENHIFGDVAGVITDAFQCARAPDDVEHATDRARIFHHERDVLTPDRLVLPIHFLIRMNHRERRPRIHPGECIQRIRQHGTGADRQMFQGLITMRRPIHLAQMGRHAGDLARLITNALEIRDDLQHRDDEPQIAGGRLSPRQNPVAFLVQGDFLHVDPLIGSHHFLGGLTVRRHQRAHGLHELILDRTTHGQDPAAYSLEFFVVTARRVLRDVTGFHRFLH